MGKSWNITFHGEFYQSNLYPPISVENLNELSCHCDYQFPLLF